MAEYRGTLASFEPTPTFPATAPSTMELAHQFPHLLHANDMDLMPAMSNSNHVFPQTSELLPLMFCENVSPTFFASDPALGPLHPVASGGIIDQKGGKKQKAAAVSDTSSGNSSSTPVFGNHGLGGKEKNSGNNNCGGGKRRRSNDKQVEKPKEVIHVRAKRGQATDSHSLAERLRREKINERMKCLQELVPGCHKTMGTAVMLDEIINYVQSLQNQVEFLSMKLTAASSFVDFNSDTEILGTHQGTSAYEAQDVDWLVREAYGGAATFH